MTVKNGTEVTAPTTVRPGYYTVGWYLDKECTQKADFPYKMTANTTFYARWTDKVAGYMYNVDYLTDTPEGQALVNSSQYTTGAEIAKIDGNEFNSLIKGFGGSLIIADLDAGDSFFSVIDLEDFSVLYKIPSKPLDVTVITLDQFVCQFVIAQYYSGYYVYDINGNVLGPSTTEPEIIVSDTILFDGTFYRYDSDGKVYSSFDQTKKTHIPNGGNGKTFYEIEKYTVFENTYDYAVNILNDKFEVIKTMKFADKAKLGVCVPLSNGGYFVQYGVEGTSTEHFFIEKDGVTYLLYSFIIGKDLNTTEIQFKRLVDSSYDRMNAPNLNWNLYSNDTISLAYILKGAPNFQSYELVKFASNGHSVTFASEKLLNSASTTAMSTSGYYNAIISKLYSTNYEVSILNGDGKAFTTSVSNIQNGNGQKYFVKKAADELTRTDFNIYDVTGKVAGDFSGYSYVESSHNVLFFEKDGNTYVFRDGAMSKLIDGTDVKVYDWGYSFKETYDDGGVMKTRYVFCTENGTIISKSVSSYAGEFLTNDGEYVININTAQGEYRLYKLTA